ncbi:uncharacterized protein LOC119601688 [Lucilia sericata]|uniref:uncharacterized protein LOC119601688 n=1 Tax=Lucilia sericata TaxID=13632 RepID=UPI0018A7F21A|nr:uncharacterized protein LOC119601688 [Lucilia sericata]XP_037808742.1 uncharacterized protein LOC119601688 [Lucilia sericata]XP_037808743.1 uncharacterized protein LOC119601688 [Lucilia sericata]
MSEINTQGKKNKGRNKPTITKKWDHNDEAAIINFLKQNREFEKPTQRKYYTKFIIENGLDDIYWKLVYYKVRNMRTVYRRAKEYQKQRGDVNEMDAEAVKNVMFKICWYVEDFDVLFPNEMSENKRIDVQVTNSDKEDETSNQELFSNTTNHINNNATTSFNEEILHEEPMLSYLPKSIRKDILAVQTGKFNFKRRKFDKESIIKQKQLELARTKFEFKAEKFRLEMKLKEKQIESQEKLKLMELQIKERIAMKELALKEKLALKSIKTADVETSFSNIF